MKSAGTARLLFYGPPGTGKTALARWLTEQLDRPLHLHRVSDLISCFIGESEKNIARAFSKAEDDNAVLVLDEVDSFLQDRTHTMRSWETTLVNEMLAQMEVFEGILVASTNLMKTLDTAAFRRFDLKVKFDYLRSEQVHTLFARVAETLNVGNTTSNMSSARENYDPDNDKFDDTLARSLNHLNHLTPGDFAAVIRQSRFHPLSDQYALLNALQAECHLKPEGSLHSMGFVA